MGFETNLYCNWGAASCGFELGLNLPWMVRSDLNRFSFSQGGIFSSLETGWYINVLVKYQWRNIEEYLVNHLQHFLWRVFSEQCLYLNIPKPSLTWWNKTSKSQEKWKVTATATFLYQATYGGVWSLIRSKNDVQLGGSPSYKLVDEIPWMP